MANICVCAHSVNRPYRASPLTASRPGDSSSEEVQRRSGTRRRGADPPGVPDCFARPRRAAPLRASWHRWPSAYVDDRDPRAANAPHGKRAADVARARSRSAACGVVSATRVSGVVKGKPTARAARTPISCAWLKPRLRCRDFASGNATMRSGRSAGARDANDARTASASAAPAQSASARRPRYLSCCSNWSTGNA